MSTPIVSAPSEEVAALHAQVRHYESELTERDAVIAQRDAMIEHLQEQVRLLVARCFAPSSEKIPEGQLGLFNEAEATAAEEPERAPGTEVAAHRRGTPPVRTGRYIGHDPSGLLLAREARRRRHATPALSRAGAALANARCR